MEDRALPYKEGHKKIMEVTLIVEDVDTDPHDKRPYYIKVQGTNISGWITEEQANEFFMSQDEIKNWLLKKRAEIQKQLEALNYNGILQDQS